MTDKVTELKGGAMSASYMSHEWGRLSAARIAEVPKDALVVQPIGSIEQHGPHLPVFTDAYIAESLVRASVGELGQSDPEVWILPTLSYGRSVEHAGFLGTVTLSTDTLLGVCRDVGRSVGRLRVPPARLCQRARGQRRALGRRRP